MVDEPVDHGDVSLLVDSVVSIPVIIGRIGVHHVGATIGEIAVQVDRPGFGGDTRVDVVSLGEVDAPGGSSSGLVKGHRDLRVVLEEFVIDFELFAAHLDGTGIGDAGKRNLSHKNLSLDSIVLVVIIDD